MTKQHDPFFVLALPRSRTAWLSTFLTYGGAQCGHDLVVRCANIAEFESAMAHYAGTCETGAATGWKYIRTRWPKARILVVQRDVVEVVESLERNGLRGLVDVEALLHREQMLEALSASRRVKTIGFEDLNDVDCCKYVFEWLLRRDFDAGHWASLRDKNIQIDFAKRVEFLQEHRQVLANFSAEVVAKVQGLGSAGCLNLN